MWLGVIIIPFSVKIAIIWFLWVVECNVHLKKLPEKLWWNNPPSWFTLHHPLLLSIFCTQAQLSVKFLLMMSTSSQLVIVCLLQMRNGQDNVSVIVVDFGYHTIHPFFCFRFLKFWIDIHLLYSRVIGVVEDFAGKCKQMVHHGIHLGYQSGGDENIMLRFPQALINRFDYECNSTCQPVVIISDSLIWAPFHLEKEPLQKWRWWTLVATFQIFTGKQMRIGWFLFRAHEKCVCPTIELLLVDSPKKWILQT